MTLILDPVQPPQKVADKTYVVGQDDISELNLSFGEVDQIVMSSEEHDENSPFSLSYRVLEDLSVLNVERRAVGYKKLEFTLKCYASARHRGVNFKNDASGYELGPVLWSLCGKYEVLSGYGDVDYAHGIECLVLGNPEHLRFALTEVTAKGPIESLSRFGDFHRQLRSKFATPQAWVDYELDGRAECSCDHIGVVRSASLRRLFDQGLAVDDIKSHLKCVGCGSKSGFRIDPVYSERTPPNFRHRTMWVPPREKLVDKEEKRGGNSDLRDLYDTLGGDGTGSMYLGDGLSVSSSGSLYDD
ncbi:hypothetical protein [Bosea sp. BK604]|uniref:hypothetical protein n=1 Tax=Bosea sp. BK604 TaxID=2512180 RepID=UPI0010444199|nr:hypothetical protein [Bosea sp. BK604]TCR63042.1 hypothetical protein EV560_109136 [Bosea sp. BK604]